MKRINRPREFVAVDGESIAPAGYCLLASSEGHAIEKGSRLATDTCLRFLFGLVAPGRVLIAYGLGYDVCHWLADLSERELARLAETGRTYTCQRGCWYSVYYIPGRLFRVRKLSAHPVNPRRATVAQVTVFDLASLAGKPFVRAALNWDVIGEVVATELQRMKLRRGEFAASDREEVRAYNALELEALSDIAGRIDVALGDIQVRLSANNWTGPGAVAAAVMRKHEVIRHLRPVPEAVYQAARRAFFAGREQSIRFGRFPEGAVKFDFRSAYASALRDLPSLEGEWCHISEYFGSEPWALWRVEWSGLDERRSIMPFPWRGSDDRVEFPPCGTGWQWGPLVDAALRYHPGVTVKEGWVFRPKNPHGRPLGFVEGLWDWRRSLGPDPAAGLAKAALVATWGKLCSGRAGLPREALLWAGMATARINALLLDMMMSAPRQVIGAYVDCVWFSRPAPACLPIPIGEGLGELAETRYDDLLMIAPHTYWARRGEEWSQHVSGVRPGELPAAAVLAEWRQRKWAGSLEWERRRLRTLGQCWQERNWEGLGEFATTRAKLPLRPSGGHPMPGGIEKGRESRLWLHYWPPEDFRDPGAESAAFEPLEARRPGYRASVAGRALEADWEGIE